MDHIFKEETMDGNMAAAMASYYFSEVAAIYPITPSSPMAELVDQWATQGRKNLFGSPVRLIEMQSEGGAAGTLHGSLQSGALTSTYTSSQGLLLMIPNLYKVAGELLPGVLHVSARSLSSNALSIFGDHQDVMSIRQTGVALLASGSVQECMDLGCIAHLSALSARIPFVHFFDGFRTSHEIQKIEVMDPELLREILDWEALGQFRAHALNPDHPVLRGTTQNPDIFFQEREAVNPFYDRVPETVQRYMDQIGVQTGRHYHLFDYYGAPDAEIVVVAMGSSCEVIRETIKYLNAGGAKYGLIQVRLYRPFSAKHFLAALPDGVKTVVVLDRTKEPGAVGEPLYQDVRAALYEAESRPAVLGGRYGLASKDFAPREVIAVLKNAESSKPVNGFTVGIIDDVTGLSLPVEESPSTVPAGTTACKFWGYGSDGTVSANKSAIKIIGDNTDKKVQAYFAYDSKKSGGLTVSHLRFGDAPIRSSYLIDHADYIACHNQSYVTKYNILEGINEGGVFLLNCIWPDEELAEHLPVDMKKTILEKKVKFYTIDAFHAAASIGMGKRINMIMQAAFFYLAKIIPYEDAVKYLKDAVKKNYGRQGSQVVEANYRAIDCTLDHLHEVDLSVLSGKESARMEDENLTGDGLTGEFAGDAAFVRDVVIPMNFQKGDLVPVSALKGWEDGTFPTNTTRIEKRNIALQVPVWDAKKCIQCNRCAFVCPHAVLRPKLLDEGFTGTLPEQVKKHVQEGMVPAKGYGEKQFYMAVSTLDCTGCGNCIQVCPAKEKALTFAPPQVPDVEAETFAALEPVSCAELVNRSKLTVRDTQFLDTYFEFSGACAGCGETPYAKLVTQLFGDRMMISNSAGCTTVWGGSAPTVPFKKNPLGQGPAWGFSLFEDNAEYGLGMTLGYQAVREELRGQLVKIAKDIREACGGEAQNTCTGETQNTCGAEAENACTGEAQKTCGAETEAGRSGGSARVRLADAIQEWDAHYFEGEGTRDRALRLEEALKENADLPGVDAILERRDYFIKRSNWVFGGDGWAYDIGYGGLDHVLSTGTDINVMVFDTEVYSNTGGQSSKATPKAAIAKFAAGGKQGRKKELGMMALQYGSVYVAQIALGADPAQALKAIQEAERYQGPSLIIGYAPCINHGIKAGMETAQLQQKRAVEAGYWNLYRYDPELKKEGKNPFRLDSARPSADYEEFLMSEVRFASLKKQNPELAERLFREAREEAIERYERYKRLETMA